MSAQFSSSYHYSLPPGLLPIVAMLLMLGSCNVERTDHGSSTQDPAQEARSIRRVQLVDSVPWEIDVGPDHSGVLWRVEVWANGARDTLNGVLTVQQPVVQGDSIVLGFTYVQDRIDSVFEYNVRNQRLRTHRIPARVSGFDPYLSAPVFAPDGRHWAYLALLGNAKAYGAVVRWPTGELIARSPELAIPPGDARSIAASTWSSADSFEIGIVLSWLTGESVRVRGSILGGQLRLDTIPPIDRSRN